MDKLNNSVRPPQCPPDRGNRELAILHPSWVEFVRFCAELKHGEIENLKIHDGLPLLAEVVRRKVKFTA